MKALAYTQAHRLETFSIREVEVPEPSLRPYDVLVEVKAFSVNPVDMKVRASRSGENGIPVILGWDVAGVVRKLGSEVKDFKVGDEIYGAGDISRDGSNAELLAIDSRIIARKPRSLTFTQAAALPLTSLTAWEAMIARKDLHLDAGSTALVIAGAGGVGSIAIQLLKAKTQAKVIATASRPETVEWSRKMGADATIDHRRPLAEGLKSLGVKEVDAVFSTTHSGEYLPQYAEILRPFGNVALIDDPTSFDILPFKRKALSVHWEFMFAKTLFHYEEASQGAILREVAELVDAGKVRSTLNTVLKGATPEHLEHAHRIAEKGSGVGKLVVER